jgi:hypothetical protein
VTLSNDFFLLGVWGGKCDFGCYDDQIGDDEWETWEDGTEESGGEDADYVVEFVFFVDGEEFSEVGPLELWFAVLF